MQVLAHSECLNNLINGEPDYKSDKSFQSKEEPWSHGESILNLQLMGARW